MTRLFRHELLTSSATETSCCSSCGSSAAPAGGPRPLAPPPGAEEQEEVPEPRAVTKLISFFWVFLLTLYSCGNVIVVIVHLINNWFMMILVAVYVDLKINAMKSLWWWIRAQFPPQVPQGSYWGSLELSGLKQTDKCRAVWSNYMCELTAVKHWVWSRNESESWSRVKHKCFNGSIYKKKNQLCCWLRLNCCNDPTGTSTS